MTRLPEKDLLAGTKTPKTTTGEMKNALGKLRDYLAELFGDDSMDKEKARQSLGIDLSALSDKSDIEAALSMKADKDELENKASKDITDALEKEITKHGIPIGSIDYFATPTPPIGYLKADGSEVGRETYPDLFAAIGTAFGEGNGDSTFNLPDLMGRFAQGSDTPGQKFQAGLPNVTGSTGYSTAQTNFTSGAFFQTTGQSDGLGGGGISTSQVLSIDASRSNPVYGASNTVQPPALTLLPCIKAFDAITDPGLIDISSLAQETVGKLDKTINGISIKYVTKTYNDGICWYRKWSDGWIEQGGTGDCLTTLNFLFPFTNTSYRITATRTSGGYEHTIIIISKTNSNCYVDDRGYGNNINASTFDWYACGM